MYCCYLYGFVCSAPYFFLLLLLFPLKRLLTQLLFRAIPALGFRIDKLPSFCLLTIYVGFALRL